jgi:PAB-dependent poly(A)-specific ribonuclease subunit 2
MCVDMKDVTVVCCGLTSRRGSVYCDPLVKVFDVRQAGRALTHLPFPPGPTRLRFHPKFSSTLIVMAASGAVMLTDVQGGGGNFKNYQVGTPPEGKRSAVSGRGSRAKVRSWLSVKYAT